MAATEAERVAAIRRHPVLIAFVPRVPGRDALAMVVRRTSAPRAIILLREDGADARRLGAAVDLLSRDEKADPDLDVAERRIALVQLPALQTAAPRPSAAAPRPASTRSDTRRGGIRGAAGDRVHPQAG
ncbi:MAG TPA: hypothetical protein VE913_11580 [Longimicrobium sp.]|nr:hypothetical protein [Longimicrobium sp.]